MIRLAIPVALCMILAATAACSGEDTGDPDRVLQVSGETFSEQELEDIIRESFSEQEEIQCAALDRLSNEQALDAVLQMRELGRPDLIIVEEDEMRAIEITREICEEAGLS